VPHTRAARYYEGTPQLIDKELKVNLGKGNKIFYGNCIDMWHDKIPGIWIYDVLYHCNEYPDNEYLFQSKNPKRFLEFAKEFPPKTMLATTIEGTKDAIKSLSYHARASYLRESKIQIKCKILITIEPIQSFMLDWLGACIKIAHPDLITIGADSKNHGLDEPTAAEIQELIDWLKKEKYKVILKENLRRIYP